MDLEAEDLLSAQALEMTIQMQFSCAVLGMKLFKRERDLSEQMCIIKRYSCSSYWIRFVQSKEIY